MALIRAPKSVIPACDVDDMVKLRKLVRATHDIPGKGGYIADSAPARIYGLAIQLGVRDFVVPGNKPEMVARYHHLIKQVLGNDDFTLYAPGFITQGGDISETGKVAGGRWHAIVGSAIYNQPTEEAMREAALQLTNQLTAV